MGAKKLNRICEFSGCGRKHSVRGLCITHHSQREQGRELSPIGTVPRIKGRDCSLLTMEQVLKKLDAKYVQRAIAAHFNVHPSTITHIKKGRRTGKNTGPRKGKLQRS